MWSHRTALLAVVLIPGCGGGGSTGDAKGVGPTQPPESRRVIVEVLNAGKQPGVARNATLRLRQQGLDVVYFGNLTDSVLAKRERNLIYVRRGDTTGVGRVIAAIGDAEIVDRADATRLVDLSVVLSGRAGVRGDSLRAATPSRGSTAQ